VSDADPSSGSARKLRVVALVPARSGSKRVANKNVRPLGAHPLIAYTIAAARSSGLFDDVVVSTDGEAIAAIARHYGARTPFLRPAALAGDLSPDIEWIEHALASLAEQGQHFDAFSLLRPTSPFRQPETIARAWDRFRAVAGADSLRAVERCGQHPAKMWRVSGENIVPVLPGVSPAGAPWHSTPYQALPEIWVQNASLEIAWCRVVQKGRTIAGDSVIPFFTQGHEGFDVNVPRDWWYAEELLARGEARLPEVDRPPWTGP
jgi:N-acylneuraminate cytidylyltransferase